MRQLKLTRVVYLSHWCLGLSNLVIVHSTLVFHATSAAAAERVSDPIRPTRRSDALMSVPENEIVTGPTMPPVILSPSCDLRRVIVCGTPPLVKCLGGWLPPDPCQTLVVGRCVFLREAESCDHVRGVKGGQLPN